jgi:RNA polymerase sigma-70 factor (ECF subfamily)
MPAAIESPPNPRTLSDEALIAAVASGDRDSFLALYDRYSPRLLGLIVSVIKDRPSSEDVLQEVMLEIWTRHAARFSPALGTVEGWLLRLARSRAIDALRKSARRSTEGLDGEASDVRTGDDASRMGGASSEVVMAALDLLRPEDREPLVLAFCHAMSREAIALHLNVPVGTVKTRIHRGVQTLRAALVTEEASR